MRHRQGTNIVGAVDWFQPPKLNPPSSTLQRRIGKAETAGQRSRYLIDGGEGGCRMRIRCRHFQLARSSMSLSVLLSHQPNLRTTVASEKQTLPLAVRLHPAVMTYFHSGIPQEGP